MWQKHLFFMLFPLISLACAVLTPNNPAANRPVSTVFDDLVCEPPCWNHIVPGTTTEEQAREILKVLAGEKNQNNISEQIYPDERVYLSLRMNYPDDGTFGERITLAIWDSIVKRVVFEGAARHLSLTYVLETIGNPDYAFQMMYGDSGPMLVLVYPDRGIMARCLPKAFFSGSISCNLESTTDVTFFAPGEYDEHLARFLDWRGDPHQSPEVAQYAKRYFCPWVGVDASYLFVEFGPSPGAPTASSAEIASQCPTGE